MSTRTFFSNVARLALGAACVISASGCGSELLRTGRSPVYLTILSVTTTSGGKGEESAVLHSDVQTLVDVTINGVTTQVATFFDDLGTALIRSEAKNQDATTSPINSVTLNRYHISYRRTDGRNTPGVDVPYPIDGGVSATISVNGEANVVFQAVRSQAKLEQPLRAMRNLGGLMVLSTIAEITFYGRDQNGNEVQVSGTFDVTFADFGDE